jgi:hypothetical protein
MPPTGILAYPMPFPCGCIPTGMCAVPLRHLNPGMSRPVFGSGPIGAEDHHLAVPSVRLRYAAFSPPLRQFTLSAAHRLVTSACITTVRVCDSAAPLLYLGTNRRHVALPHLRPITITFTPCRCGGMLHCVVAPLRHAPSMRCP